MTVYSYVSPNAIVDAGEPIGRRDALILALDVKFQQIAQTLGALPVHVNATIPMEFLIKSGYVQGHSEQLMLALHNSASKTEALSPAICYHIHRMNAGSMVLDSAYTAVGQCFRFETKVAPDRFVNFTMREIMFTGTAEYVLDKRLECLRLSERLFDDLGLAYLIVPADDAFCAPDPLLFKEIKDGKFEMRAELPFYKIHTAIASFNYQADYFGRTLGITLADGSPAHTGCVGYGLERCALALASQGIIEVKQKGNQ